MPMTPAMDKQPPPPTKNASLPIISGCTTSHSTEPGPSAERTWRPSMRCITCITTTRRFGIIQRRAQICAPIIEYAGVVFQRITIRKSSDRAFGRIHPSNSIAPLTHRSQLITVDARRRAVVLFNATCF